MISRPIVVQAGSIVLATCILKGIRAGRGAGGGVSEWIVSVLRHLVSCLVEHSLGTSERIIDRRVSPIAIREAESFIDIERPQVVGDPQWINLLGDVPAIVQVLSELAADLIGRPAPEGIIGEGRRGVGAGESTEAVAGIPGEGGGSS